MFLSTKKRIYAPFSSEYEEVDILLNLKNIKYIERHITPDSKSDEICMVYLKNKIRVQATTPAIPPSLPQMRTDEIFYEQFIIVTSFNRLKTLMEDAGEIVN